jgi:hypothetical protein
MKPFPTTALCNSALQDCLAMGAIFSATDSVATLQVLDRDALPSLFALVGRRDGGWGGGG